MVDALAEALTAARDTVAPMEPTVEESETADTQETGDAKEEGSLVDDTSSEVSEDEEDDLFEDETNESSDEPVESDEDKKRYSYERRQKEKVEKQLDKLRDEFDALKKELATPVKEEKVPVDVSVTNKTVDRWIEENPDEWEELMSDSDEYTARALVKHDLKAEAKYSKVLSEREQAQAAKEQAEVLKVQLSEFNEKTGESKTIEDFQEIYTRVSNNLTLERLHQIDNMEKVMKDKIREGYRLAREDDKTGRDRLAKKKQALSVKKGSSPDVSGSKMQASNLQSAMEMASKKLTFTR